MEGYLNKCRRYSNEIVSSVHLFHFTLIDPDFVASYPARTFLTSSISRLRQCVDSSRCSPPQQSDALRELSYLHHDKGVCPPVATCYSGPRGCGGDVSHHCGGDIAQGTQAISRGSVMFKYGRDYRRDGTGLSKGGKNGGRYGEEPFD